ncbi:MAG: hypothetical protein ACLPTJ_22025 [Solirubrobacteraceae bacterium]
MTGREKLYGLPLDRFIPERGALVKQLRKRGDRDEAAAVGSLRKPSIGAWAVNQLVRTQRRHVKALFDAGDKLQTAQAQLLAGRADGQALREAVERERAAVDTLVEMARGLLSADGHELTPATLERVFETLHAAALDEQARSQVSDGCLERELRHVGLGGGAELAPARRAPDEHERADAKREQHQRTERLTAARKAEADARRAAERTERELQKAHTRRDEAEQALAAAREQAQAAAAAHKRAQAELEQL